MNNDQVLQLVDISNNVLYVSTSYTNFKPIDSIQPFQLRMNAPSPIFRFKRLYFIEAQLK